MSVVDEVRSRLDIVDVVSGYVPLKKAGRSYKATCPFHTEKTPSFVVSPERQTWHCFGACSTGGDAFSFVMRKEDVEFGEALRLLADRTGVDLRPARQGTAEQYEALYRVNQEAASFYQRALASPEGSRASAYLAERGVDEAARTSFKLGFSPSVRNRLKTHLHSLGFDLEHAVEAGLLRREDDGSVRDFFWGRLMFPIQDRRGRVIGFGGRSLDGSEPKYINTAASPIFDKRANLYGLHLAIEPTRESNTAVVVEGYMDVIAAHQAGFPNVVASMGTALTERQVGMLRAAAGRFVLALDPDVAGQEATLRSLEASWKVLERHQVGSGFRAVGAMFQARKLELAIAALPTGQDPDTLIRRDPGEWKRTVAEAKPYVEFMIRAIAARYDLIQPRGRAEAAEVLAPVITAAGSAIEQEHYFQLTADALGVSRQALEASIGGPSATRRPSRGGRARAEPAPSGSSPVASEGRDYLEEFILSLLLRWPDLRDATSGVTSDRFHGIENRELFTSLQSCSTIDELRGSVDVSLHDRLDYLSGVNNGPGDRQSDANALDESLRRLEQRHLRELQESMLASGDAAEPPPKTLEEPIVSINTRLRDLSRSSVRSG